MAADAGEDPRVARVVDAVAAFGLGEVVEAPAFAARGAMGEVWRAGTTTGVWAIKVLFAWNRPEGCPPDVAIQAAAMEAGVRLPRVVTAPSGDAVMTAGDRRVRAYEWVDLDPPLAQPVAVETVAEAGWILGRIHSMPVDRPIDGPDGWYTTPPNRAEWEELVVRADEAGTTWAQALAVTVDAMVDLDLFTATDAPPSIIGHRDFDPSNVLPHRDDGCLVVLDWENAGPIPPDWELAAALGDWACHGGSADPERVRALLDGYRRGGGTATIAGAPSFRYGVSTMCNYLRVLARQALEEPDEAPHALPQLDRLLAGGIARIRPSVESILTVLDTIRRER